ncbi:MAG: tRNA adenylyltransferase, partial [Planctomycetota bacterium]
MSDPKLRQAIAAHAAMLMYTRDESEYFTAKRKAAKRLGVNFKHCPQDLPSNAEIRERLRTLAE